MVGHDAKDIPFFESFANGRGVVSSVKPHCFHGKAESPTLSIKSVQIGYAVMHIGGSYIAISNNRKFSIIAVRLSSQG